MALDPTIGGSSSTSYVTLTEANDYFADRLNVAEWDAADNETREKALITATRRIDEETFRGRKASTTQALKWPRVNVQDEDGLYFDSTSIPERVKQATFMAALELLKADYLAESYLGNYSFMSAGNFQFKQFTQQSAGRLPAEAVRLLSFVMIGGSGGGRLIRA